VGTFLYAVFADYLAGGFRFVLFLLSWFGGSYFFCSNMIFKVCNLKLLFHSFGLGIILIVAFLLSALVGVALVPMGFVFLTLLVGNILFGGLGFLVNRYFLGNGVMSKESVLIYGLTILVSSIMMYLLMRLDWKFDDPKLFKYIYAIGVFLYLHAFLRVQWLIR